MGPEPLPREYLQVQTCLQCCKDDVDRWVLVACKYGTSEAVAWDITRDDELWERHLLPAVRRAVEEINDIVGWLKAGRRLTNEEVTKMCKPGTIARQQIKSAIRASMRAHVGPPRPLAVPCPPSPPPPPSLPLASPVPAYLGPDSRI